MQVMALGRKFSGELLFPPVHENEFIDHLLGSLEKNAPRVRDLSRATSEAVFRRGEVEPPTENLGDPRSVGWTFLLNAADGGETVQVVVGGIDGGHSGLVPGQVYYWQSDGSLGTTPTAVRVGLALSESELLLEDLWPK